MNIDELVIRGVSPRDRHRLAQEIQQELTTLLKVGGMPPAFGAPGAGEWPGVSTRPQDAKDHSVARQIARDIYQSMVNNG